MVKAVGDYKEPVDVAVEEGETYWFCRCGKSKNQPWCDGAHSGSAFSPMEWVAPKSRTYKFCACKLTDKAPICDFSHDDIDEG